MHGEGNSKHCDIFDVCRSHVKKLFDVCRYLTFVVDVEIDVVTFVVERRQLRVLWHLWRLSSRHPPSHNKSDWRKLCLQGHFSWNFKVNVTWPNLAWSETIWTFQFLLFLVHLHFIQCVISLMWLKMTPQNPLLKNIIVPTTMERFQQLPIMEIASQVLKRLLYFARCTTIVWQFYSCFRPMCYLSYCVQYVPVLRF